MGGWWGGWGGDGGRGERGNRIKVSLVWKYVGATGGGDTNERAAPISFTCQILCEEEGISDQ